MRKGFLLFCFLFFLSVLKAQSSLELTKLLHADRLNQMLSLVTGNVNLEDKTPNKEGLSELEQEISKIYKSSFTEHELKEIHNFYESSVGKKFLKEKINLSSKINSFLISWEMKKMGIEVLSVEEIPLDDNIEDVSLQVVEQEVIKQEEPSVKITNLEELRTYLTKNPEKIYDSQVLSTLLNIKLKEELIELPETN